MFSLCKPLWIHVWMVELKSYYIRKNYLMIHSWMRILRNLRWFCGMWVLCGCSNFLLEIFNILQKSKLHTHTQTHTITLWIYKQQQWCPFYFLYKIPKNIKCVHNVWVRYIERVKVLYGLKLIKFYLFLLNTGILYLKRQLWVAHLSNKKMLEIWFKYLERNIEFIEVSDVIVCANNILNKY